MKKIFIIFLLFPSIIFCQKLGESKFKIKLEEENKFIQESSWSMNEEIYDSVLTYAVSEAHIIFYYFKDNKCNGIEERVIGANLKQTYSLYKNILDSNDFGLKISEGENYSCFKKNGANVQVIIEQEDSAFGGKWSVFIRKGFVASKIWYPKTGC